jgi:heptosyltransferase-2
VDLNFLGDMLLSSPVYRALKQHLPGARVDALVYDFAAAPLRANPFIDRIHLMSSRGFVSQAIGALRYRRDRYDLVLQLNTSLKTNVLLWLIGGRYRLGYDFAHRGCLNNLRVPLATRTARTKRRTDECVELLEQAFAWKIQDRGMIFAVAPADLQRVRSLLNERGRDTGVLTIGIHAHCRQEKERRQWPPERFAQLASALIERYGARIMLTGGAEDRDSVRRLAALIRPGDRVLSVAGDLSLGEFAALLTQLSLFVTINTGPMHIAVAVRTPTVAIIGGTPASIVFPVHDPAFRFLMDPALRQWNPDILKPAYAPALETISVEDVMEKAADLLRQKSRTDVRLMEQR